MRTIFKFAIALMVAAGTIVMPSCNTSEARYKYLTKDIPAVFAVVDVLGASTMTPDKFFGYINENFDKSLVREIDNGIAPLYEWKKDGKYTLSEDEDYYCCATFDYNRNPHELTIIATGFIYKSPSADNVDKFYSIATDKLEPLMAEWGFKLNQNLTTSTRKYYLRDSDFITIEREGNEVAITRGFH